MMLVARVQRRDDPSTTQGKMYWSIWKMWRDNEFLSLISKKFEWGSSPSILITRNPNWSQRSGTETGCIKESY
jgi:hypothetical protein